MGAFRACVQDSDLWDLTYRGPLYTWWNNQQSNPTAKKLDRILVNEEWKLRYPTSYAIFDSMSFSDHRPGIIHMGSCQRTKASFKFSNYLLDHPDFMDKISDYWGSTHFAGNAMYCLTRKLRELKPVLKSFNLHHFSDLENRVTDAHRKLLRSQENFLSNPTPSKARAQKIAQSQWWRLAEAEDKFLKQRARIKWLKEGDRNTSFFHRTIQGRKSANRIHYLVDQGNRLDKKDDIANHSIDYFSNILGTSQLPLNQDDVDKIRSYTNFRCEDWMKELLQADITALEIRQEVFSLPKGKCPGPDGYTAEFYIRCWPIIGEDFISAVREFFDHGQILKQINATNIVLIPKCAGADSLPNFRPISLCNVLYKVISKILTRRLESTLATFISNNQTAFVKGRSLVENVILATELVKGFGTKMRSPRGALKVDLSKAFDTIRWDFILSILEAAEFPICFVNWIKECISTTSFSVCLNGESCGFFKGRRGLRQGDPLSPMLFLMAMQVFSEMLKAAFDNGKINLHELCQNPMITHLSFADDIMIFFDGRPGSLRGIREVLQMFKTLSGLSVNMTKTTAYLTGTNRTEEIEVEALGFRIGTLPVRYLGLPLLTRRMQKLDFLPLLETLSKRFSTWAVRTLSFAGRLQLISSVIYSVTNFWMGAFSLPKGCLREITRLCTRFLWTGNITTAGNIKVSWKTVCLPKIEGGLGLRDFASWNKTLQLNLISVLFTKEDSLWAAWVHEHWLKRHLFWTTPITANISWIWRCLLHLRPLAQRLISCRIGNGERASFWHDNWSKNGPLIHITGQEGPQRVGIPINASVAQAADSGFWRSSTSRARCPRVAELRSILLSTQPPTYGSARDKFLWGADPSSPANFSTKKIWEAVRHRQDQQSWTRIAWTKSVPPKHTFLFWVTSLNRLPLRSRLRQWGLSITDSCYLCSNAPEDREHLFLNCEFVLQIWAWLINKLRSAGVLQTWDSLLNWITGTHNRRLRLLKTIAAHAVIYMTWKERNTRLHDGISNTVAYLTAEIDRSVRASLLAMRLKKHHSDLLSLWFIR